MGDSALPDPAPSIPSAELESAALSLDPEGILAEPELLTDSLLPVSDPAEEAPTEAIQTPTQMTLDGAPSNVPLAEADRGQTPEGVLESAPEVSSIALPAPSIPTSPTLVPTSNTSITSPASPLRHIVPTTSAAFSSSPSAPSPSFSSKEEDDEEEESERKKERESER